MTQSILHPSLFEAPPISIPGMSYHPNYVAAEAEAELLKHIDAQPWITDLKRRVQHYGYRYSYKTGNTTGTPLGPLPAPVQPLPRGSPTQIKNPPTRNPGEILPRIEANRKILRVAYNKAISFIGKKIRQIAKKHNKMNALFEIKLLPLKYARHFAI